MENNQMNEKNENEEFKTPLSTQHENPVTENNDVKECDGDVKSEEIPAAKPERITSIPKYEPKTYVRETPSEQNAGYSANDWSQGAEDQLEDVRGYTVNPNEENRQNKTWLIIAIAVLVIVLIAACCHFSLVFGFVRNLFTRTLV